ncbi:MAG: fatty acid desaturase [Crocinitomicaceae bacterium]|nr:fatty acid desaturase [Crocinitomicaceae bacterium]
MHQNVTFQQEPDAFFEVVKERVDNYFVESGQAKQANSFFFFKAFVLIGTYIGLYAVLMGSINDVLVFSSMLLMGPFAILIGINVAHDAAHNSISKKAWVNTLFLNCFDLLGANSYMWKRRHVYSHHAFPNILNNDADLKQNPLVRIFPNDEVLPAHRYQFIYAPFLYLLYTLNWLFFRDYQDYFQKRIGSLEMKKHKVAVIVKLVLFKLFYVSYILILPMLFSRLSWEMVLLAFLGMNFMASLLITLALIPSHVAENSLFLLPNNKGVMPNSWSHHQVLSVIDFATNNWFLNFFFGGFNHHVAHHLFPSINHTHCTAITPIIKQTAQEFGLPYNHEDSFFNAYLSHFRLLKNNGVQPGV